MGMGEPNLTNCEEALKFVNQQIIPVEHLLSESHYFGGKELSIADFVAYAYLEQASAIDLDLSTYPKINAWFKKMEALDSIKKTKTKVKF